MYVASRRSHLIGHHPVVWHKGLPVFLLSSPIFNVGVAQAFQSAIQQAYLYLLSVQ
jgi:hypothetical protein